MISSHKNNQKNPNSLLNPNKTNILSTIVHHKSIRTFPNPKTHLLNRLQPNESSKNQSKCLLPKVNDQNSSMNANSIQIQSTKQSKPLQSLQYKQTKQNQQKQQRQINTNQVVSLKKKIKKCSSHQITKSQNLIREKITFIRKIRSINSQQDPVSIKLQEKIQTFPVYRDSQIFVGEGSAHLRHKLVIQRLDNDDDSEDQIIEKFVHKVKTQFLHCVQKVKRQREQPNLRITQKKVQKGEKNPQILEENPQILETHESKEHFGTQKCLDFAPQKCVEIQQTTESQEHLEIKENAQIYELAQILEQ